MTGGIVQRAPEEYQLSALSTVIDDLESATGHVPAERLGAAAGGSGNGTGLGSGVEEERRRREGAQRDKDARRPGKTAARPSKRTDCRIFPTLRRRGPNRDTASLR